jgi:hypothetical protein
MSDHGSDTETKKRLACYRKYMLNFFASLERFGQANANLGLLEVDQTARLLGFIVHELDWVEQRLFDLRHYGDSDE